MFPWQIYNFFKAAQASTEVFCEKGVLKNFAIFTGKHLCWSLNLIKLRPSGSCLRDCNFVKKRLQHRCFSVNIATFLRNIFLKNICEKSSADISILSPQISKFCYIKKYRYRLHFDALFLTLLTFLGFLEIALINMVTILMMSAKMATVGLLKIKLF